MKRTITLAIGIVLVVLGLLIGAAALFAATSTPLEAEEVSYLARLTMVLTAGASVSILSGVATLLISARR